MATLTVQEIAYTGLEATYASAAGAGDQVAAGEETFLHIKNGSGSDITVTVETPGTVSGIAIVDPDTVVTAGEERFIGPLGKALFGDPTDSNLVSITYTDVTTLTIAAIKL